MNTNASPPRDRTPCALGRSERRALVHELPSPLRDLYREVLLQTMRNGVPIDPDSLVVVLSALDEHSDDPLHFRVDTIEKLLWYGITELCSSLGITRPERCADALFAVVAIAWVDERFAVTGDDPDELFAALRGLAGVS